MILSSFSFTFCGPALCRCWWRSRSRSDRPRSSRVRLKCLTPAVCVSMLFLQDNRCTEQASINNRQLHRALERGPPPSLLTCHRSSLKLSRLVPRLSETHTSRANKPFHRPQPVCGFQHPSKRRPCDLQRAVVT